MDELKEWEEMARDFAIAAVDEEIINHPNLANQRESLLAAKTNELKQELMDIGAKVVKEINLAVTLAGEWLKNLPKSEKEKFEPEIKAVGKWVSRGDFEEQFLNKTYNIDSKNLREILHLSQDLIDGFFSEAKRYGDSKEYDKAFALDQFVLILDPQYMEAIYHAGYCNFCQKDLENAQIYFDYALALSPEDPKAYYLSALNSLERKDRDVALELAEFGQELGDARWKPLFDELLKKIQQKDVI